MRQLSLLLLVFGFMLAFTQTAAAQHRRQVDLHGTIVAVGDAGIVLHTDRGDVRIHVTPRTRIFRNGERVRLHSLHVRDRAFVRAVAERTRRGIRYTAYEIRARGR